MQIALKRYCLWEKGASNELLKVSFRLCRIIVMQNNKQHRAPNAALQGWRMILCNLYKDY